MNDHARSVMIELQNVTFVHLLETKGRKSRSSSIIDRRCNNRWLWESAQDCRIPTPSSQKLRLEYKSGFTGSTIINVSMHEYTNSQISQRTGISNSYFAQILTKKADSEKLGFPIDNSIWNDFLFFIAVSERTSTVTRPISGQWATNMEGQGFNH
jgi:hypothetical protein